MKEERLKEKAVLVAHMFYILAAGLISILFLGFDVRNLMGLFIGFLAAFTNYLFLIVTVRKFLYKMTVLTVQIFVIRYLFYLIMAYISMRIGMNTAVMYGIGITGLPFAIFIIYGIGGMKKQ